MKFHAVPVATNLAQARNVSGELFAALERICVAANVIVLPLLRHALPVCRQTFTHLAVLSFVSALNSHATEAAHQQALAAVNLAPTHLGC